MFLLTFIEDFRFRLVVFPAVVLAFTLTVACLGTSGDAADARCSGLEVPPTRDGLISRSEAERLATERLVISAPGVSGTEIERVWASCLTTLRSYQHDLLKNDTWINPAFYRADAPAWIVEVKGISRPDGLSAGKGLEPYRYALVVFYADTGDSIAGRRSWEPLLEPAEEVHQ